MGRWCHPMTIWQPRRNHTPAAHLLLTVDVVPLLWGRSGMIARYDQPRWQARPRRPVGDRGAAAATPRPPYGGRHRTIGDRNCLAALALMARTSTPWPCCLPRSSAAARHPLPGGGWVSRKGRRVRPAPPRSPGPAGAGRLDWSRASVDSASVRAKRGDHVGANPIDRGKPGSKLHLVSERYGLPLTAAVTAANVNDTGAFAALLDDVPAVLTPGRGAAHRADAVVAVVLSAVGGGIGTRSGGLRCCCWPADLFASSGCGQRRPVGGFLGKRCSCTTGCDEPPRRCSRPSPAARSASGSSCLPASPSATCWAASSRRHSWRGWCQYMMAGVLRRKVSPFSWPSMNSARSDRETLGITMVAWMSAPLR
jgi:Transposase DDE domain